MLQSLRVVTAPAGLPVQLSLAKAHLRIDHDDDDDLIEMQVGVATEMAEAFLNRALVAQTLSYAMGQSLPTMPPYVGGLSPILPLALSWPLIVQRGFDLPRSPVASLSSVSLTAQDGTVTDLTSEQFQADLELDPARVRLNGYGYGAAVGLDVATVTYKAGYASVDASGTVDVSAIPVKIRQAVLLLTAWLYENRGDGDAEKWPPAVERLLWPHRLVTFGG